MGTDVDTRERLLQAGAELARERGVKALTVRAVAAQAGANLGSFVHHFGTREAFVAEVIERWYAPIFQNLQLTAAEARTPLQALSDALLQLLAWLLEHRAFVAQLLLDAGAGEPAARRFLRSVDQRHPALLLALLRRAQQAGELRREEPLHQMLFLMSSLAMPVLAFHIAGAAQPGTVPPLLQQVTQYAVGPEHVRQRLEWALRGLAP